MLLIPIISWFYYPVGHFTYTTRTTHTLTHNLALHKTLLLYFIRKQCYSIPRPIYPETVIHSLTDTFIVWCCVSLRFKAARSVYSSWMYIFQLSYVLVFCSCDHLDFPVCRTFDFSMSLLKVVKYILVRIPIVNLLINSKHTTVPLPCVCKRWMWEKQRLYGGRERRMRVLCEFSAAAGFSVSSR